jgi:hypothetical protein
MVANSGLTRNKNRNITFAIGSGGTLIRGSIAISPPAVDLATTPREQVSRWGYDKTPARRGFLMPTVGDNWKCPYCGHAQVINGSRFDQDWRQLDVEGEKTEERLFLGHQAIVCANGECRELSLWVYLGKPFVDRELNESIRIDKNGIWTLRPPSSAKPQPDYIPKPIRDDYYEACAIRDLSPKASATITRRCLQGMIRDFCGISRRRLIDEINDLRKAVNEGQAPAGVQPDAIEAIDCVRQVGNIGAHMEEDINVIVDVDPDEAQLLIELVELLFKDWYVAREGRQSGFAKLKALTAEKKVQKQQPPTELPGQDQQPQ